MDLQSFCMSITTSAVVARASAPSCGQSYGRADTFRSCLSVSESAMVRVKYAQITTNQCWVHPSGSLQCTGNSRLALQR